MYKRRDWMLTHGADGGGDDTSSSSEDISAAEDATSSDADVSSADDHQEDSSDGDAQHKEWTIADLKRNAQAKPAKRDPADNGDGDEYGALYAKRLEDLSEDDFEQSDDEEDEEREQSLIQQLEHWNRGAQKGNKALKCILCGGKLMLNAGSWRTHLESKKHRKNEMTVAQDGHDNLEHHEMFCFAEDYDAVVKEDSEEEETYLDRAVRVENALQEAKNSACAPGKRRKGESRKRPGKRQRQLAKESYKSGSDIKDPQSGGGADAGKKKTTKNPSRTTA